jgi:hypothetical protein
VCGRYGRGDWLPSGERNPHTRETPCDNFVCDGCQEEARLLREVSSACDRQKQRPKITLEKTVKKFKNGLTAVRG